ncbi:MAG: bifunctional nuclease family protein [Desulfovibrio sp.]|nr:bifunctional nuclease family protein [Desulfovibrio sp.]
MVEMHFEGLHLEERGETVYVAVLHEIDGDRTLSLEMGPMEGLAISLAMQKEKLPRPLTHDLLIFCLRALQAQFMQSIITDYRDGMFYAAIELGHNGRRIRIDSRPADALALSLRTERPIFTTDKLLERMRTVEASQSLESLPLTTPDAATEMVRRTSAKHILDMINTKQEDRLPDATSDEHLLELLRSLEPATRCKM